VSSETGCRKRRRASDNDLLSYVKYRCNRLVVGGASRGEGFDFDVDLGVDLPIPFRLAETRRMSWGFGVCLFERSEFTPRQLIRASQGTHNDFYYGQACGCRFFWLSFL
jgi:hypothetical protein